MIDNQNNEIFTENQLQNVVEASNSVLPNDVVDNNGSTDNNQSETQSEDLLVFSDSAANKVKELITEEKNSALKLRVFITGGGCSGFEYGFTFTEEVNDDDYQLVKNDVSLLVDAMSLQYLEGAEIDYKEDMNGAQFIIRNPNAVTTCGCGSSFSV